MRNSRSLRFSDRRVSYNGFGAVKAISICILIIMCSIVDLAQPTLAHQESPSIDWNGIREAYENFIKNPSSCTGAKFLAKLPETPILRVKEVDEKLRTYDLIISPINHSLFRRIVLNGNAYAVEAVFRLLNISDGAGTEELLLLLGRVMKEHPRLYLEILDKYKDMEFFRLVGGYGVEMNTEPLGSKERMVELQNRINSLETVQDVRYRVLRDRCILELRKAMKRGEKAI
jgi:hypothetical protein